MHACEEAKCTIKKKLAKNSSLHAQKETKVRRVKRKGQRLCLKAAHRRTLYRTRYTLGGRGGWEGFSVFFFFSPYVSIFQVNPYNIVTLLVDLKRVYICIRI